MFLTLSFPQTFSMLTSSLLFLCSMMKVFVFPLISLSSPSSASLFPFAVFANCLDFDRRVLYFTSQSMETCNGGDIEDDETLDDPFDRLTLEAPFEGIEGVVEEGVEEG